MGEVLPFIENVPNAPLLKPNEAFDRLGLRSRLEFGDVTPAPSASLRTRQRQRFRQSSDIDVLDVAVFANEIEDDALGARIAQRLEIGILGMDRIFIEQGIKKELAFLEPAA